MRKSESNLTWSLDRSRRASPREAFRIISCSNKSGAFSLAVRRMRSLREQSPKTMFLFWWGSSQLNHLRPQNIGCSWAMEWDCLVSLLRSQISIQPHSIAWLPLVHKYTAPRTNKIVREYLPNRLVKDARASTSFDSRSVLSFVSRTQLKICLHKVQIPRLHLIRQSLKLLRVERLSCCLRLTNLPLFYFLKKELS